jgi:hypothetical protein
MNVTAIGKAAGIRKHGAPKFKTRKDLEAGLREMKGQASLPVRDLLNIITNWSLGTASPNDCLAALERLRRRWQGDNGIIERSRVNTDTQPMPSVRQGNRA